MAEGEVHRGTVVDVDEGGCPCNASRVVWLSNSIAPDQ